jgi:hypothetical protein
VGPQADCTGPGSERDLAPRLGGAGAQGPRDSTLTRRTRAFQQDPHTRRRRPGGTPTRAAQRQPGLAVGHLSTRTPHPAPETGRPYRVQESASQQGVDHPGTAMCAHQRLWRVRTDHCGQPSKTPDTTIRAAACTAGNRDGHPNPTGTAHTTEAEFSSTRPASRHDAARASQPVPVRTTHQAATQQILTSE